ncbi:TPA: hypothetical protein MW252_002973 [Acinetobacter nosocomialis]|nr:hypothetical protein [Acinetobacter nosocomialis]
MSSNFRKFPSIPLEALTAMSELREQLLGPSRNEKFRKYYLGEFKYMESKPKFHPGQWVMFRKKSGIEDGPYTIFEAFKPVSQEDYLYVIGKVKSKLELTATFEKLRLMTQTEIAEYVAKSRPATFGVELIF